MGIQQLLIIAVSIIILGLSIYISYYFIQYYLQTSNREELITTLNKLCLSAQQYYRKPREQGGGAGSFLGWSLPQEFKNYKNGIIRAIVKNDEVNFNAIGNYLGIDNDYRVNVDAVVNSSEVRIIVVN
ncbi:MAG: hypothetical protein N2249_07840 [Melioribacter sp.]|nr:hypothetical protein [Melioribacter sp.]